MTLEVADDVERWKAMIMFWNINNTKLRLNRPIWIGIRRKIMRKKRPYIIEHNEIPLALGCHRKYDIVSQQRRRKGLSNEHFLQHKQH